MREEKSCNFSQISPLTLSQIKWTRRFHIYGGGGGGEFFTKAQQTSTRLVWKRTGDNIFWHAAQEVEKDSLSLHLKDLYQRLTT